MIYCHECGSEIAQIDTFCPFCGIVLKPFDKEERGVAEQDKTVAVNQTEFQDILSQDDAAESPKTDEPEVLLNENNESAEQNALDSDFNSPGESEADSKTGEMFLKELELENSTAESDATDAATSDDKNFDDEISGVDSTPDPFLNDTNFEPNDATMIDVPRPQVLEADFNDQIKFTDPEFQQSEIEIADSDSETAAETSNDEIISENEKAGDEEFIQTISYSNYQKLENQKSEFSESPNQSEIENTTSQNDSEIEIAKPENPVEEPEIRDTTFDSVKIMDDVKVEPKEEPRAVSANIVPEKERSHTTPNIGVGDTDGRKSPKLKPLDEGTVLNGRYEIVRKIGGGGMGAVYLATDRNLGGILRAVKEMIQSYIEETQQDKAISDFKRESMLLTSLDHPSIPTIYDYFYDDKEGRFYLVMKYISGGDLASRLRAAPEGRIEEESVVSWAIQIADVLDYLHNRQPPIVYRDLKPANIMIDGNTGRTMLIDFGIARWINKEEKGVTAVGTMGYAPPELFSGNVEPASDIYSLGSTMFHLLTGADPQSNPLLIFDFQKHPRPRQINPQLSDQIEKILLKMVEYNADKRYKTAGDVRDELTKHLETLKGGSATFGITKAPSAVAFSDQKVFCGFCGQKIVATDMFCAFCGSRQPIAQQGVHSAEYHLPMTTAKLFVVGTNDLEMPTFVIEKDDNLLGRRDPLSNIFPEVDLSKYDPQTKISRRHAHIFRDGNDFKVEDLGSSNGTLILRVVGDAFKLNPHQPHTLVNGEKIKIGDTTLHFVVG